jgi:ABC-type phosphate/phosphonate transport system substrate-binding protein
LLSEDRHVRKALVLTGGGLAASLSWLLLSVPPAEARAENRRVKIGLVSTLSRGLPPALVRLVMQPFKSLMEAKTGLSGDVVAGGEPLVLAKKLVDDDIQLGVFHGHEFAWAKAKYPKLTPVAVCVNRFRTVKVHLVVRKDSEAVKLCDLKDKTVALPRSNRDHCRVFFESRCVHKGCKPEKFYKELVKVSDGEEALDQVFTGKIDAALVDAVALEGYKADKPGRGKRLRVLHESEPFPSGVIAYHPGRFAEGDIRAFRDALISAKNTAKGRIMLEMLKLTAFEAAPADYNASLKAIARAYPPPVEK